MANRSYLYASDLVPAPGIDRARRRMIGISEWGYDIPVVYKLLVGAGARACVSSIWKDDGELAIVGEYEGGVRRLFAYLDRCPEGLIRADREEAREFLCSPDNRRKYFVLECGEIFMMREGDWAKHNLTLFKEIPDFDPPVPRSEAEVDRLGLGNWSNELYFTPDGGEE